MLRIPPNYRIPVGISIVLHIILLVILAMKLPTSTTYRMNNAPTDVKIVNAVAVNPVAVQTEINRIKNQQLQKEQQEQQKRVAAQAHLQALQQQALAMQKQHQAEQVRIAQLQEQRLRLQKEAQHAAEVKKQAEAAAKKAEELAKQKTLQAQKIKDEQKQQLLAKQQQLQQQLMQNQLAQEQKQLAQARASQMQGVLDQYKAQIIQAIQQQWIVPDNANKDLSCVLLIHLAPSGVVLSAVIAQTSGDAVLDRSARDAVFKASPLPVPQDSAVFESFRDLRLTVRPLQVTGG